MQPCKTGDQPYSDASPNGECSLARVLRQTADKSKTNVLMFLNDNRVV